MKRFKVILASLVMSAMVLLSAIFPTSAALAASPYDTTIVTTDKLEVSDPYFGCSQDFTETWATTFREYLTGANLTSFDNRAAWTVQLLYSNEGNGIFVPSSFRINWWEAPSTPVVFNFNSPYADGPYAGTPYAETRQLLGPASKEGYVSIFNCNLSGGVFPQNSTTLLQTTGPYQTYYRMFEASGIEISYPVGYEGVVLDTQAVSGNATYVAMGDSFSSGEGVPDFETGTDPGCHRSLSAYPRLLQNDTRFDLQYLKFVACSGATTWDVMYSGQNGEPKQVDALTDDTKVVTLSIGGNDVSFRDYVIGCVAACGPSTPGGDLVYDAMMDAINAPAFKQNLKFTYEEVLERAENADVYVVDYPYLADEDTEFCVGLDLSGAYSVQTQLNSVIATAVAEVGDSRLHLVKTNYEGSPFEGNGLCSGTGMFHHLVFPFEYSMHPMASGQEALRQVVADYMINN